MQDSVLRLKEVVSRVGLKRSSIYDLVKEGAFPAPISLSKRARGWLASEVQLWIEARTNERNSERGGSRS
ncbi:hypothetical protein MnTg02_01653 [bacterium MnTg02]|nr:hypothetical protein MnTg02_01653 [bacterium MnTg02]